MKTTIRTLLPLVLFSCCIVLWFFTRYDLPHPRLCSETASSLDDPHYPNKNEDKWTISSKPKLSKVSMLWGENSSSVYHRALDTQQKYATRYKYPFNVLRREIVPSCREHLGNEYLRDCNKENAHNLGGTWTKLIYIESVLVSELSKDPSRRVEWLVWQDADTISLSMEVDLAIFLPPSSLTLELRSHIHFLYSEDVNGLNCGVFFLRVSDWSLKFVLACLSRSFSGKDIDLGWNYEQDAISYILNFDSRFNKGQAVRQPKRWYNSYDIPEVTDIEKGDTIVHFPGVREPTKTSLISGWLDKISNDASWTSERSNISEEVDLFWKSYAKNASRFL